MPIWTVTESQITELEGFDISWLPETAYSFLTPRRVTGGGQTRIAIEAGPYIGVLPLLNGDPLYIAPRMGQASVSRMLLVTGRLEHSVRREFEHFARLGYGDSESISWLLLLARTFAKQLRQIEKSSPRFDRAWVRDNVIAVSGRVDVPQTLTRLQRREGRPVVTRYRERTLDTKEHRILGAASAILLQQRVGHEADAPVLARWAHRAGSRRALAPELLDVVRDLNANQYVGARSYYIPALVMAQLLLMQGGVVLSQESSVESESMLTNVSTLYEHYLRMLIRNELTDGGYVIEKRESGAMTLFVDGTGSLIPDVIVSDRSGVRLLIDAKYKPGNNVDSSDYYQMAAYLKAYRADKGIIVRPGHSYRNVIRRLNAGGLIEELTIELDNWETAEDQLITCVNRALEKTASA